MVASRESAALAEKLISETCAKQGITRGQLSLHADRGSSMTPKPVALLLADLGVTQSHSRPPCPTTTGTSWSAVHNFSGSPELTAAAASGPGDVWGFAVTGSPGQTPGAVHYNGKRWSQVAIPVNVTEASGSAAAGDWVTGTSAAQPARIAVLRWSKGAWRNVPLPKISVPKGEQMQPGYIAAVSPTSVWASAVAASPTVEGRVTYVLLHWNGRAWSKVPLPKGVNVYGLAGDGHGGAWVASYKVNEPGVYLAALAMYHYAGGRWTRGAVPVLHGLDTNLQSGNMELIPGTRSVLASATMFGSASVEGGILKYGP